MAEENKMETKIDPFEMALKKTSGEKIPVANVVDAIAFGSLLNVIHDNADHGSTKKWGEGLLKKKVQEAAELQEAIMQKAFEKSTWDDVSNALIITIDASHGYLTSDIVRFLRKYPISDRQVHDVTMESNGAGRTIFKVYFLR